MRRFYSLYIFIIFIVFGVPERTYSQTGGIDTTVFVTNEILSRPTDKSITISIVPKKNLQIYFEYGTSTSVYSNQSEVKNSISNTPLRFVLLNLLSNTRYYYRMRYKQTGSSEYFAGGEHTFITQRAKGSTYKFTLEADSHLYDKKGIPIMMKVTMQNQANDSPDFIFDLGDTFGDDHNPTTITQQDMMQLHLNFLPYIGMVCHSAPFFFCLGNHEGEDGYDLLQTPPNNIAVYGTLARKFYYANPSPDNFYSGDTVSEQYGMNLPENYYAFEWGDALFVILDVYRGYTADSKPEGWDWTLGVTQYNWFSQTLKNSNAKYKFVFAHHVSGQGRGAVALAKLYEWGGYELKNNTWGFTANRPGWELPIHQLMVKYGVSVFFQGHDHLFAQEVLDGLVYQEVPMPSDSTYMIGMLANADAYTSNQLNGTGHIRVTVSPANAKVEYIRAYLPRDTNSTHRNGEIAFSYTVTSSNTTVEQKNEIPNSIQLKQNYPNPFNPSTEISYQLTSISPVTLKVYDVLGREISTLVNEVQGLGIYSVKFDASQRPSGIYFYCLSVNNKIEVKKMIYQK